MEHEKNPIYFTTLASLLHLSTLFCTSPSRPSCPQPWPGKYLHWYKEKYPHIIQSFQRYLQNRDESDEILNRVKNDILLMLYNNRKNVFIE